MKETYTNAITKTTQIKQNILQSKLLKTQLKVKMLQIRFIAPWSWYHEVMKTVIIFFLFCTGLLKRYIVLFKIVLFLF